MADFAVIGLGAVGASALYWLSKQSANVIGFDRYAPPHDRGSSHGESRLVRLAYAEGTQYVELAKRSVDLWLEQNRLSGQRHFYQDGMIYAGPPDLGLISGVRKAAREHGLVLEPRSDIHPFQLQKGWEAVFEPDAGFACPEPSIRYWLDSAKSRGAAVHTNSQIRNLEHSSGRWVIETAAQRFSADRILIAAGGWTSMLRPSLDRLVHIERRVHNWYQPGDTGLTQGQFPAFTLQDEEERWFYGAPQLPGGRGVKLSAHHNDGQEANAACRDPDSILREVSEEDGAETARFARQVLPGLGPLAGLEVCFYTLSRDGDFIIEDALESDAVMAITGLSGHGFKFATALGEHAALRMLDQETQVDLSAFAPDRPFS